MRGLVSTYVYRLRLWAFAGLYPASIQVGMPETGDMLSLPLSVLGSGSNLKDRAIRSILLYSASKAVTPVGIISTVVPE